MQSLVIFRAGVDAGTLHGKTSKEPTIREKFNTYQFAEYKESVIELLGRVCTVSVETMKIVKEMP